MGIIPQITTTFIALVLTLLAGYVVFLSTTRANIEGEIQVEGAKIVDELQRSATFEVPLPYTDIFLLQHYQAKYPNLSGPTLPYRIVFDLQGRFLFDKESMKETLDIAAKGNAPGNLSGRITLWAVQQSVASLLPSRVPWPGHRSVRTFGDLPASSQEPQEALFPFGPLGVDNWVRQFRIVQETMALVTSPISRDIALGDLQEFLRDAPEFYKRFQGYNYGDWLVKMDSTLAALATSADRISSLLRLKDTFSITSRLPNLGWVLVLGILLSLVGLVVPLMILSLGLEKEVPSAVNLAIMPTMLIFILATIGVLALDITKSPDQQFAEIRYFLPLRDQVLSDKGKKYAEITFSFDLVSGILSDADRLGLSKKEAKLLEEYRTAIKNSNFASERAAGELAIKMQSSAILNRHKAPPGSGGTSLPVLGLLGTDNKVLSSLKLQLGANIIIQAVRGHVTTDLLVLRIPEAQKGLEEIEEELGRIYETFRRDKSYEGLTKARAELDNVRQSVLKWLNERVQRKSG